MFEPGSYIEMRGEDGALWRWVFDGKTCKEITAKITWDNNDVEEEDEHG